MASQVKYQVFVSSTYEDLKEERDAVIKAILEMGHIPVGMEMFSAADEEQWAIIARHIEQSDYYAVIIAHRLGSISFDGISYTRKEYEYARKLGIPCLGFVIEEGVMWPTDRVDTATSTKRALDDFKSLIREKPVAFWRDAGDLHSKFAMALMKSFTASPREGWVRASGASSDRALAAEVARLSAENGELRKSVKQFELNSRDERNSEKRETIAILGASLRKPSYRYYGSEEWQHDVTVSLFDIFRHLGPEMLIEASVKDLSQILAMSIREDMERKWDIVAVNQTKSSLADLMTMNLVQPSVKRHAVSDTEEYWSLSPFGIELLKDVRKLELVNLVKDESLEEDSLAMEEGAVAHDDGQFDMRSQSGGQETVS